MDVHDLGAVGRVDDAPRGAPWLPTKYFRHRTGTDRQHGGGPGGAGSAMPSSLSCAPAEVGGRKQRSGRTDLRWGRGRKTTLARHALGSAMWLLRITRTVRRPAWLAKPMVGQLGWR